MARGLVVLTASAVVAGVVLSPMTIAGLIALALISTGICRGLPRTERQIVLWVLAVAIGLRLAAIAALFLLSDPNHLTSFPFDGDGRYLKLRSLWIRNIWLGVPIDTAYFTAAFDTYGWTSYVYVLAYLQYLLGPAPYAVHLLSACWALAATGLLHRLVRRSYGPAPAVLAITAILFMPTLFMWSVSAMKESWYLLLMTTVLVGVERGLRGETALQRIGGATATAVAMLVLGTTRRGAVVIAAAALAGAVVGTFAMRRVHVRHAAILTLPLLGALVLQQPSVQEPALARLRASAQMHIGFVLTQGYPYKLLDQRFYSGDSPESMTWDEGRRFALRAMTSFVLVPLPWQSVSRSQWLFIPQQLAWYGLVLLAVAGVVRGCRTDVFVTWLFISVSCVGAAVIAPNEGNMGTLVRHRDGIVPFVLCLSALGAMSAYSRVRILFLRGVESSVVLQALLRLSGSRTAAARSAGALWRGSALAAAVDDLRAIESWQWLRGAGAALLAGALLAGALGRFGDQAWPSLMAWAATVLSSLLLIAGARGPGRRHEDDAQAGGKVQSSP